MQQPACPRMHRGRRIPEGQHDAVRPDGSTPRNLHEQRLVAGRPLDPRYLAENPLQHRPVRGAAFRLVEHLLQIAAV